MDDIGGGKVLTTADYNYPANNPTGVALWLLKPGIYARGSSAVTIYWMGTLSVHNSCGVFVVGTKFSDYAPTLAYGYSMPPVSVSARIYLCGQSSGAQGKLLDPYDIADNLYSGASSMVLSGKQGTVLAPASGSGAPTTATQPYGNMVGKLYIDTDTQDVYVYVGKNGNDYIWKQINVS